MDENLCTKLVKLSSFASMASKLRDFVIIAHFHSSVYYDGINSHLRALLGILLVDVPVWFRNLIWFGFNTISVHLMNLLWTMNIMCFHSLKKV